MVASKHIECPHCDKKGPFVNIWCDGDEGYVTATCTNCGRIFNFHPIEGVEEDGYVDVAGVGWNNKINKAAVKKEKKKKG